MNDEQTPALRQAVENMVNMREAYDNLSQAAEAYNVGKTELAAAITTKGVATQTTDPLTTMAGNVLAIPNVTKEFVQTNFVKQWIGEDAVDSLTIIHQFYTSKYPTAQCYTVLGGTTLTIPIGVSRLIYYNNGVLTTVENPDGDYIIGAAPESTIGFALLQYTGRTITSLAIVATTYVFEFGAYNADITIQGFTNSRITMVQMEDCNITFASSVFSNSRIAIFLMYNSQFSNGEISNASTFDNCINLVNISLPQLVTISGGSTFINCTNLINISLPQLVTISGVYTFGACPNLVNISLPQLVTISGMGTFTNCPNLVNISLPQLVTISGGSTFINCTNLVNISLPQLVTISGGSTFTNCTNLINITTGAAIQDSLNLSTWNPVKVLEDATKKTQLVENIRNNIAANLPDRTGQKASTVIFHANVKEAIAADQQITDAFTNKNWIIA